MKLTPPAVLLGLLAALLSAGAAHAGGPRYVAGQPYFTGAQEGTPIGWRQPTLLYSTDPGPLSASVNHASADALVTSAANVWNVPVASITLAQGPPLAEHVSSQNVYLGSAGVVFPADVMSANAAAVPLAVIYDADGSVTDTLLGSGASSPASCRQNAVTETVDSFDPAGYILHAIIVINGRCTGPAPQQQMQLRYQLERIFGRVLGLAWSQANDNVYTGSPAPTAQQALNWPIMHPLDIICGAYTYQCLPQPFTLRPDDIASLVAVYPNAPNTTLPAGKQPSLAGAFAEFVPIRFPTGEGMAGVNVLAQVGPRNSGVIQPWITASSVTGWAFRRGDTSPFVAQDQSPAGSFGMHDRNGMANAFLAYVPVSDTTQLIDLILTSEPINPLYTGTYALATNSMGEIAPSGSNLTAPQRYETAGGTDGVYFTIADAAESCGNGEDGNFYAPAPMPASGWWTGHICDYNHLTYTAAALGANRSLTVEVTALDANGLATIAKLRPVIGLYSQGDNPYAPPTAAVAAQAFQALTAGTTTLTASSGASPVTWTLAIADQRGGGRPDFNFQARVFYAASISPAIVPAAGAKAVISGLGFRPGNVVTVNGVGAQVTAWTQNSISLTLPALTTAHATSGIAVDVTVSDLGTGAVSTMSGALTYLSVASPPPTLRVLTAPAGPLYMGTAAQTPFTVQELAADGVTPIANEPVSFTLGNPPASAPGTWSACGTAVCTVVTDANGKASSTFTPTQAGSLTLTAADAHNTLVTASSTVNVLAQAGSMVIVSTPSGNFYNTQPAGAFTIQVLSAPQNGNAAAPMPNRSIQFSVTAGGAQLGACAAARCTVMTDGNGKAQITITPLATGQLSVQAVDGALSKTLTLAVRSWADTLSLVEVPPDGSIAGSFAGYLAVRLMHGDGSTPDGGQTVRFTASAGVNFGPCGNNSCSLQADGNGFIRMQIGSSLPGTFTVQAAFGSLAVSTSFQVLSAAPHLELLSVPTAPIPVGIASPVPLTVRLVDVYGKPISGAQIRFAVPGLEGWIGPCGQSALCGQFTGTDGTATVWLTPLTGHVIPVDISTAEATSLTASFTGVGSLRHLSIVQQPGSASAPLNQAQTIVIEALGLDGVTPAGGDQIDIITLGGQVSILGCQISYCRTGTDGNGLATFSATPIAPGLITIEVLDEADPEDTLTFSFIAITPPDRLHVLSAPADGALVGQPAAAAFALRLFAPDGVTPLPGRGVTLAVTGGQAGLGACAGASSCVLPADSNGMLSTSVTPIAPGQITLLASEGGGTATASFAAANPPPDRMALLTAPADGAMAGQLAAPAFAVKVFAADQTTPAPGRTVTLTVTAGQAILTTCGKATCAMTTAADGIVSTGVQVLGAGSIALLASEVSWGQVVSVSASFTAVSAPDLLVITEAPPANDLVGTPVNFTVQALLADAITPAAGKAVLFTVSGPATLSAGSVLTDSAGLASVILTPTAAGSITASASEGTARVSASLTASTPPPPLPPPVLPDRLVVLSAPTGSSPVAQPNGASFAIEIIGQDGVSPAPGRSIHFAVVAGQASLSVCAGASACTVPTDAAGTATTSVTPSAAGLTTVTATEDSLPANTASASFTAVAMPVLPPPVPAQELTLLSAPGPGVFSGITAATPFGVRLTLTDGVTPVAGVPVTFTASATGGTGSAHLVLCGAATCTVFTDAAGMASTAVTAGQPGTVTLSASAPAPAAGLPASAVSASFEVVADRVSFVALTPRIYIAEATPLTLSLSADASENGSPAAAATVLWTATPAVQLSHAQTTTAATGDTAQLAAFPALAAGAAATVTACAQFPAATQACAMFTASGVAETQFAVTVVSGGLQQISSTSLTSYAPVIAQVTDRAVHPIAGAAVTIYQTVTAVAAPCPFSGRCPAAPIIAQQITAAVTDAAGNLAIQPLAAPTQQTPTQQTQLALSAGTAGFATTILTSGP